MLRGWKIWKYIKANNIDVETSSINAIAKATKSHWNTVRAAIKAGYDYFLKGLPQACIHLGSKVTKEKKIYRGQAPGFSTSQDKDKGPPSGKKSLSECIAWALARGNGSADERSSRVAKRNCDRQQMEYEIAMSLMREKNRAREIRGDGLSIRLVGAARRTFLNRSREKGRWQYVETILKQTLEIVKQKRVAMSTGRGIR